MRQQRSEPHCHPNGHALEAAEGDNCFIPACSGAALSAVIGGSLVDVNESFEWLGDEYHSEPNYRAPKDVTVYVPVLELHFKGGEMRFPLADLQWPQFFRCCCDAGFMAMSDTVVMASGRAGQVLRILPERNEFGELLFRPDSIERIGAQLAEAGLIDVSEQSPFAYAFTKWSLRESAHRLLMRYDDSSKQARILRNKLEREDSHEEPANPYGFSKREFDRDRIDVLEQDFAVFTGELRNLISAGEIHDAFRRLADMKDYSDLDRRDWMILERFCEVPPPGCIRVQTHPRISLVAAQFSRQFGPWLRQQHGTEEQS